MSSLRPVLRWGASHVTPLARTYVRYAPWQFGRRSVFGRFHWRHRSFDVRIEGGARIEGSTHRFVEKYLYWFGVWEPWITEWMLHRLRPGDIFVDVGANIGYYSLRAGRLVGPEGHVIAVEASPATRERMAACLERHDLSNVTVVEAAAGATMGTAEFYFGESGNPEHSSLLKWSPDAAVETTVDVKPLDTILEECDCIEPRLVKIDVEGGELHVLDGARRLLGETRETEFLVEVGDETRDDVVRRFREAGYRAFRIENPYGEEHYLSRDWSGAPPRVHPLERGDTPTDLVFSRQELAVARGA